MIIPASIGFKGTYDIVLRDTITGKIKDKRKIDNLLLNGFKRFLLDDLLSLREINSWGYIYIGTDNTPPSRSDTGVKGTTLASIREGTTRISSPGEYPFTYKKTVKFGAGVGTGSIGEIVLRYNYGSTYYGISRIALDPKIEKTDTDELNVTYTLTVHRSADVISGTIPGGQRDGVTDINWKLTFNNEQLYYFLTENLQNIVSSSRSYVRLGDSNADSDLINDKHNTLKGNQIAYLIPFHYEWLQYSSENDYRDLEIGFETDQGKGNIAEMILFNKDPSRERYYGVCRVTFDPPLDNTDPNYRLYLTFRFYIELGEETDVTIEGNNNNG